jgi:hypothetical protein
VEYLHSVVHAHDVGEEQRKQEYTLYYYIIKLARMAEREDIALALLEEMKQRNIAMGPPLWGIMLRAAVRIAARSLFRHHPFFLTSRGVRTVHRSLFKHHPFLLSSLCVRTVTGPHSVAELERCKESPESHA